MIKFCLKLIKTRDENVSNMHHAGETIKQELERAIAFSKGKLLRGNTFVYIRGGNSLQFKTMKSHRGCRGNCTLVSMLETALKRAEFMDPCLNIIAL